jgi:aryl-alcohol dehydrogenase-like predicted oxidoreductase
MRYAEFAPVGRATSRVGLGCGRLVGRSSQRESAKMVETALDLGIRYFDVAPSYGLGTAEEVLGAVIGSAPEVVIATKVGVPPPVYSERVNVVRKVARSVLGRLPALKALAGRAMGSWRSSEDRPRYDFSDRGIRASLEESLRKLRRGSVDVMLAHEPHRLDLSEEVAARFEGLRAEGLIKAFGVGIGATGDRWARFGSIWQSCWPGPAAQDYAHDVAYIWHGAIRALHSAPRPPRPAAVVREVLRESPTSILLVSASTPTRLRELLGEIDS